MEAAGPPVLFFQLRVGQEVQYWSKEGKQWIPTTIIDLDVAKKSYKVDCKKNHWGQDLDRLRMPPKPKREVEDQKDSWKHVGRGSSLFIALLGLVKLAFLSLS
jgi:hypothetical protein